MPYCGEGVLYVHRSAVMVFLHLGSLHGGGLYIFLDFSLYVNRHSWRYSFLRCLFHFLDD